MLCLSSFWIGATLTIIFTSQKLNTEGTLTALVNTYQSKQTEYSVSGLSIPHFVYKSWIQVQITQPIFESPYDQPEARKMSAFSSIFSLYINFDWVSRIVTLYQILHDSIHGKSVQQAGLKLQYIRTSEESVMGWVIFFCITSSICFQHSYLLCSYR